MITWTEDKGQGRSVEVPHTPTPRQGGLVSLHLELRSWVQTCGMLAFPLPVLKWHWIRYCVGWYFRKYVLVASREATRTDTLNLVDISSFIQDLQINPDPLGAL